MLCKLICLFISQNIQIRSIGVVCVVRDILYVVEAAPQLPIIFLGCLTFIRKRKFQNGEI